MIIPEILGERLLEISEGGERHPVEELVGRLSTAISPVVDLRSNDYLALSGREEIWRAEAKALAAEKGHGFIGSGTFSRDNLHRCFEKRFAEFVRSEDALLFGSGFAANESLLRALVPDARHGRIYLHGRAHASFWEGLPRHRPHSFASRHPVTRQQSQKEDGDLCPECGKPKRDALPRIFTFKSLTGLQRLVERPGFVFIDALYSTDGSLAPLNDVAEITRQSGCFLVVDETHSFGAQGPEGRGLVVELGLEELVHFRTIGLSKAIPCRGGVIVGPSQAMELLRFEAPSRVFSTEIMSHEVAGFSAALSLIEQASAGRRRLEQNHAYLRDCLLEGGLPVLQSSKQIVALPTGREENLLEVRKRLESAGIFGSGFCYPATSKGQAFYRFSVNASLDREALDKVIAACKALPRKLLSTRSRGAW